MYIRPLVLLPIVAAVFLSVPGVQAFTDVSASATSATAIESLTEKKIISGYTDGTFQPNKIVSRAEFMKMVVSAMGGIPDGFKETKCFDDVDPSAWFAPYVCYGKSKRFVGGTSKTFAPTQNVNVAEAVKIAALAFQVTPITSEPNKAWYVPFVKTVAEHGYFPTSFSHTGQEVRRADAAELLWRVMEKKGDLPSRTLAEVKEGKCIYDPGSKYASNVDVDKVRSTWMGWHNAERASLGLAPYSYNLQLERTAMTWSTLAKQKGSIDHKRPGTTAYYDYYAVKNWFANQGVTFLGGGTPFSESIGWGRYTCTDTDCTDELISAIKSTHNFFMSEKGRAYDPHYAAIASRSFREIGLGIVVDPVAKKYYLTTHYGTRVAGASSVCGM